MKWYSIYPMSRFASSPKTKCLLWMLSIRVTRSQTIWFMAIHYEYITMNYFPYGAFSSPRSYTSLPPLIAASPFREAEDKASEITAEYLGNDSWIPEQCLCGIIENYVASSFKTKWIDWERVCDENDCRFTRSQIRVIRLFRMKGEYKGSEI